MQNEWSAIYEQHVYDVYRFLLYFLGSHEEAQANALKKDLSYAIQAFKTDHRVVVVLRGLQQQSAADAGVILGWTVNRVNVTFHRAIQVLRNKLSETGGEWHESARTMER